MEEVLELRRSPLLSMIAKKTNVESTAYALAFSYSNLIIWIAGGVDKGIITNCFKNIHQEIKALMPRKR